MSRRQCRHYRNRHHRSRKDWFVNQKRSTRADMTVALGWRVRNDVDGMGMFVTHQYIPGSVSWVRDGGQIDNMPIMHWADITFLSKRPKRFGIFYNTTISTVAQKTVDEIEDEAYDAVMAQLSDADKELHHQSMKLRWGTPKNGLVELKRNTKPKLDSLGGKTFEQARCAWMQNYLDNELSSRVVHQAFETDRSYCYGVGLHIVLDAVTLNVDTISQAVATWWARDEIDFKEVVDIRPHLPAIKAMLRFQIAVFSKPSGQSIDWTQFSDEEQRHLGYSSVAVKG